MHVHKYQIHFNKSSLKSPHNAIDMTPITSLRNVNEQLCNGHYIDSYYTQIPLILYAPLKLMGNP